MTAGDGHRMAVRWSRVAPLVCAAIVLGTILTLHSAQPAGVFWDDGVYLISARSIAMGDGYAFAHLPGAPAAVHFPPVWPLLLAGVWWLAPDFPANLAIFGVVNPLLAALAAGLTCAYAMDRARLAPVVAVVVTTVFALTLPVLALNGVLFAEPLFLVVAVVALMAGDRATDVGGARNALFAGLAVGVAVLTRSTAIALIPALMAALLIARRPREAVTAAAAAGSMVIPWMAWSAARAGELAEPLRGNYGPYLSWFGDAVIERGPGFVAEIARQNLVSIERSFAVVFFPVGVRELRPLLLALLCVAVALGVRALWSRARTLTLFALFYAIMVIVWPYTPDRFAWAVWPLVGVFVAAGAQAAWGLVTRESAIGPRVAAAVVFAVACLAIAGDAFYSARGVSRGWVDVAQRRNGARLAPTVDWVARNTTLDDIIACDGEPLVHLYTGRRVVPVHVLSPTEHLAGTPVQQAADDLRALLVAGDADYAVLSARSVGLHAASLLGAGSGSPWLSPVDTLPGGGVAFRVDRSP